MGGPVDESAALQTLWVAAKAARQAGDLATSTAHLREALALAPDNLLVLRQLATQLRLSGAVSEALALLEPALPRAIDDSDLALTLADCLLQHSGAKAALGTLDYVLRQRLDQPLDLLLGKARLLFLLQETREAQNVLRQVVQRAPERADAWALLGAVEYDCGNSGDAFIASRLALKSDPKQAVAHGTLGQIAAEAGDLEKARKHYTKALALEPENARIQYMLGLTDLTEGDYAAGWRGYAWRHRVVPRIAADYSYGLPAWRPEETRPQGRLMIWGEQGVGDEIMFAGLASELLTREIRPRLLTDARLVPMLSRSLPGIEVMAREPGFAPRDHGVTRQVAAGDLGAVLRQSMDDFPRRNRYLVADPARVRHFRAKYADLAADGAKLVGIAWRSSNQAQGAHKSVALADFAAILRQSGCVFVNLQYGNNAAEIAALREQQGLTLHDDDEVDPLRSLEDQAAQIAALDRVVSVSNSAVHLAGALGMPTWLLLPGARGVQWYWGRSGQTTPWYSSLKLLRAGPEESLAAQIARRAADFPAWLADSRAITHN